MARFDVYANPEAAERKVTPYFVDIQNDFIDGLDSRVVIPLRQATSFGPRAERLHPVLTVRNHAVVLDTAALGAIPRAELRKAVDSLKSAQAEIQIALDALLGAY